MIKLFKKTLLAFFRYVRNRLLALKVNYDLFSGNNNVIRIY